MATLLITKETGNFFSLKLNDETPIISEQNRLTTIGDFCHFKTVSGANIIKDQNILYSDITLVSSGSFTFTSVNALWVKLIEVGFFDGLGTGGGGVGVDQFTELLDTFNSYIGRDGQALVVNESELKIETVPFANVSAFTDLTDAPNPLLPNKMIITNATGTALIMTDLPTTPEQYLNAVGSFHYSDLATQTTPLNATANTELKITNDTLGAYTDTSNAPFGVSSVYNSTLNQFDFSSLSIGDMVHFRPDLVVDLIGTNTSFELFLRMGIGSVAEYDLEIATSERKSTDAFKKTAFIGFDISNEFWRDNPAEFYFKSDANATVKVNGYYFEIIRKSINIVHVANDETKQNKLVAGTNITIDETDPLNPIISSTGGGGGDSFPIISIETFTFTSSQSFVLTSIPFNIISVVVNMSNLHPSQYTLVAPKTILINDTLDSGDKVTITYNYASSNQYSLVQNKKLVKYTLESSLPILGDIDTIYFLNVSNVKYLKLWNGSSYVTANMIPDLFRDYYAEKSDIDLVSYLGVCRSISVIEDEDNDNTFTHYFYNGSELQWIVSVNQ